MTTITLPRATVEQALEALEAMQSYAAAERKGLRICDEAIDALRAALAQQAEPRNQCRSDGRCQYAIDHGAEGIGHCPKGKCVMAQHTQPAEDRDVAQSNLRVMKEMFREQTEPAQQAEPVYWEVRCTAHPKWIRVDKQQFDEYVAHGWEGQRLYTAPPQQAEPVQEPVAVFDARWGQPVLLSGAPLLEDEQPLYTAPPQRKPLTEEEIDACRQQGYAHAGFSAPFDFGKAARAVERAHGIGEGA